MKTQKSGTSELSVPIWINNGMLSFGQYAYWQPLLPRGWVRARLNGGRSVEEAGEEIPKDGKYTWIKGRVKGDYVYGVKEADGNYHYEVRYDAGPGDLAVMEKFDIEYLSQLLREGTLREKEPDVWMLREMERAQNRDIGEWWHEKLQLPEPELRAQLDQSSATYQHWLEETALKAKQAELKAKAEKAKTAKRVLVTEICRCALCHKIMLDPVLAADGETYERERLSVGY